MTLKIFTLSIFTLSILYANMNTSPFKPSIQLSGNLSIDKMRKQNIAIVKKAVEGLNQNLPIKIDDKTKLVKVDGKGKELIYIFEIKTAPKSEEELKREGKKKVAPRIKRGICQSAERFLKAGIDITYIYLNASTDHQILKLTVTQKDCFNIN